MSDENPVQAQVPVRYEGTILRIRTTKHNIKQETTFVIANIRDPWGDEHTIRGTACQRPGVGDYISGNFTRETHPQYGDQLTTRGNIDVYLPREPRAIKKRIKDIVGHTLMPTVARAFDAMAENNPVGFWDMWSPCEGAGLLPPSIPPGGPAALQFEEVASAINAYKNHRKPVISSAEVERYFAELGLTWSSATIRRMLGYDDSGEGAADDPENPGSGRETVLLDALKADPLCIIELLDIRTSQVIQYLGALRRLGIIDEPTATIGELIKECMVAEGNGQCCVPFSTVRAATLATVMALPTFAEYLTVYRSLLYRRRVFEDEKTVAELFVESNTDCRNSNNSGLHDFDVDVTPVLAGMPPDRGHVPNAEQIAAVKAMLTKRMSTVQGSAGTGKTTALRLLARYIKCHRPELASSILFLAPTGKAVNRIKDSLRDIELTGTDNILTIHRFAGLLRGAKAEGKEDTKSVKDPVESCVMMPMLIAVDESSMISLSTMAMFVRAVRLYQVYIPHIVFIGDGYQLTPVGAGAPYLDLIESGIATNTTLSVVHRQGPDSALLTAITDLREGVDVSVSEPGKFEIGLAKELVKPIFKWIDAHPSTTASTSIIVPTGKRGLVGKLTPIVRDYINPASPDVDLYAGTELLDEYRKGDKVMQIVNNYGRNVFNGEVGEVIGLITQPPDEEPPYLLHVRFNGRPTDNFYYSLSEAGKELQSAYVLTTHKSQGSEYDDVLVVMDQPIPGFINRNHIYTAASRGKRSVKILITQREIMRCWKYKPTKPLTGLVAQIAELVTAGECVGGDVAVADDDVEANDDVFDDDVAVADDDEADDNTNTIRQRRI